MSEPSFLPAPSSLGLFFQVGHGPEPSNESIIMAWTLPKPPEVQFIGFSTGWGSVGEFRIWRKVEADESYSEAFTLGVPHSAIPGSESAAASIIGVSARQPGLGRMGASVTSGSFSFWVLLGTRAFGAFSQTPTHLTGKQLPVPSLCWVLGPDSEVTPSLPFGDSSLAEEAGPCRLWGDPEGCVVNFMRAVCLG